MTSIEWLWEQIDGIIPYQDIKTSQLFNGVLEQAKEMHKQEIIDAWEDGQDSEYDYHINNERRENAMEYYQETFGSKGSDDHISDISKIIELPQQEISDEEIEKASKYIQTTNPDLWTFKIAWKAGAKWYREQLKSKGNETEI